MREIRLTLTKREYEHLSILPYKDLTEEVLEMLPASIVQGYGFYGCRLTYSKEENKYYVICMIGESCD
jgi:hypothetical protein